jgi:sporulation integral membrane protein YlbJ
LITPVTVRLFGVTGAGGLAFVTGTVSGYPIGAKTVGDLYRSGEIDTPQAQRLMFFCNNAGPLFIVGAVGIGMFGSAKIGYVLWLGHIAAAVFLGIAGKLISIDSIKTIKRGNHFKRAMHNFYAYRRNMDCRFGKILGESVKNAMEAMLLVGGLIIFFNVAVHIVQSAVGLEGGLLGGLVGGVFEVTGGARAVSREGANPFTLALAAGIIAFGGLSVHTQALHFTAGTGIKAGHYIFGKTLHGLLAAVVTVIIYTLLT